MSTPTSSGIKSKVLYEDNHIIAINKDSSEIVQEDKTGDVPLFDKVKAYIKQEYNKPGEVFLGVIHRIDRPVSGIVLFAKTSKALERMNEMFQKKEINKTYWALVKQKPVKDKGTLIHYIARNQEKNFSKAYEKEIPGSKLSELDYSVLCSSDTYHLLEIKPKTGRHHQIRVQLAKIGSSIKGDLKYGAARSNPGGGINLHAREIEFIHPVKLTPIKITANPPKDSLWNAFLSLLSLDK